MSCLKRYLKDVTVIQAPLQNLKTSATFSLAEVPIKVQCQDGAALARLSALWRQFFYLDSLDTEPTPEPALTFSFGETGRLEPHGEELYRTETLRVTKTAQGFSLRCAQAWLELNPAEDRGEGTLPGSFWQLNPYAQREFFLLSLLMLLRPHGLYGLHANGLAWGEQGLLIVGPSGSGKTTLTLSLLKQGWQFVSDDALLLEDTLKDTGPLRAYAFRRGFSFTPQTETFISTSGAEAMYDAQDKRVLDAERLFPEQFAPRLTPRLVLFPEVSSNAESELTPLAASEALILLVQQSAGSMVDKALAARQLELLKRLVQTSKCYRLRSGKDVITQGERVSATLKNLLDVSRG